MRDGVGLVGRHQGLGDLGVDVQVGGDRRGVRPRVAQLDESLDGGVWELGVGGVLLCGLVWVVWPPSTPVVAVLASLGSLAVTSNLDVRLRFPFFTEAVVLIVMLGAVLWQRAVWSWPIAVLVVVAGESIALRAGSGGVRNVVALTMLVLFAAVVTVVVYESPHRIVASMEAIAEVFGDRPVVMARELTKQFEEVVTDTPAAHLERLRAGSARGEFVIVIPAYT